MQGYKCTFEHVYTYIVYTKVLLESISWLDFGGPKQADRARAIPRKKPAGERSRVALPERNRSASTHGGSGGST